MRILITNDDGYEARGLQVLVEALKGLGELTVVAPKKAQSGMSMAVSMGFKPIAVRHLEPRDGQDWWYLDGTPASCVKFGIDNVFFPERPDLVVSGVNHGNNAATATLYSGTVGAAMEGAVNGIPSIAVSLDSFSKDADFSSVERFLPGIVKKLVGNFCPRKGTFYNINFPAIPADEVKGILPARMGYAHWEKEYVNYWPDVQTVFGHTPSPEDIAYLESAEPGEALYVMAGDFTSDPGNPPNADHLLMEQGFIAITPQNIYSTDAEELHRLCDII